MCVDVNTLAKKYSIPPKKILIIASISGAYIDKNQICGELDEKLINKYKEIEEELNEDAIVELDDSRLLELFKDGGYNIIRAYNTLFVTRRIPVKADILAKFPEIKRFAVLLGNTYYVTPSQYLKLKILMQKEKERVKTLEINLDDE